MKQENSKPKILIVDDEPKNIRVLSRLLKDKYTTMAVTRGREVFEHVTCENRPDLILLDVSMPDMDGYEVCRRLKAAETTRSIPVIFVTSMNRVNDELHGFEVGAVDYIRKPFNTAVLEARVRVQLKLSNQRDCPAERLETELWHAR